MKHYTFTFFTCDPATGEPGSDTKITVQPTADGEYSDGLTVALWFLHLGLLRGIIMDPHMWDWDNNPSDAYMWARLDGLAEEETA